MADHFLDVLTVARRLDVAGETVRAWIRAGKLRAIKTPGGQYKIRHSALAAILAQKSQTSQIPTRSA